MIERLEARRLLSLAGPDGFGYQADAYTYENLDLNPGAGTVTVALDGLDDDFAAIPLGSNTFTFYGTTYHYSAGSLVSPYKSLAPPRFPGQKRGPCAVVLYGIERAFRQ